MECDKAEVRSARRGRCSVGWRLDADGDSFGGGSTWICRGGMRDHGGVGGGVMKMEKIQLLSSSSVAVSTSQDFDDNATITAFWKRADKRAVKEWDISATALKREREKCVLFQSPWHRVCLFCVCIPDWKQERPRRRETRAWPSV